VIRSALAAALLALLCTGCPSTPPLPGTTPPATDGPRLPPAVLADPGWILLVRPGDLLDAPAVQSLLSGLEIDRSVADFVARGRFDLARLGWLRVESKDGRSLFVLPLAEAEKLAATMSSPLGPPVPGEGAEAPPVAAPEVRTDEAGDWGIVYRVVAPAAAALQTRPDDPEATELAKLLHRVEGAGLVFWVRGPIAVRPELDPAGLLAQTTSLGCAAAPVSRTTLRFGCVLFGVRGDNLYTGTLQTLVRKVFDSTLGRILDLEGASESLRYDPEPGAAYVEAELKVEALLPGLRVIASVPLAHLLEGNPPAPE
jgi:hypothetical protein